MVLALNMADEAKKENLEIDVKQIEAIIGVPVVLVSANSKEGIEELLERVHEVADKEQRNNSNIIYSDPVEEEILELSTFFDERGFTLRDLTSRELAIRLIFEDKDLYKELHEEPIMIELQPKLVASLEHIYTHHDSKNITDIKASEYIAIARGIRMETVKCEQNRAQKTLTKKIGYFNK